MSATGEACLVWQQGAGLVATRGISTNVSVVRLDAQAAGFADCVLTSTNGLHASSV